MSINYNSMMEFARRQIKFSTRTEWYPFRDRFSHTLRVLNWAERIHKEESGDWEIIKIAGIFHDVGWHETIGHNMVSESIAKEYLTENNYNPDKLELVLEAIRNHNQREADSQVSLESLIIMDADILDEVGAISIIWDSMASSMNNAESYEEVYERIKHYYEKLCNNARLLKTKTGMKFYEKRLKFIAGFIEELEFELFTEEPK